MKKILALALCVLMIVTAALPVFATTEPATAGKLAITEVAHNPDGDGANFEYIEIINTVENTTVNLADYYIYRFMFSHSGKFSYSGMGQLMGTSGNNCAATTAIAITAETAIAYNTPTLVWLKTADKTVEDFVNYWKTKNANLTSANVVTVDLTDYVVSNWKTDKGDGFLPDTLCGFVVSFVNDSFASTDELSMDATTKVDSSEAYGNTVARHTAADTMTLIYATGDIAGKVANRYGYFDADAFNAAVEKAKEIEIPTAYLSTANQYPALMMPRPNTDGSVALTLLKNTSMIFNMSDNNNENNSVYFLNVTPWEDPSPATLVTGQFGNGTIATTTDVRGTGLAMTEICVATEAAGEATSATNTDYEFVEVKNTTANALTLTDYRVVLLGGTNSGKYDGLFASRTLAGTDTTDVAANEHNFATVSSVWQIGAGATSTSATATSASTALAANGTAVIWFKNSATADDVAGFAKFWEARGNDMDGVVIAVADYCDTITTKIYTRGNGFLPDTSVAYSLSLVNVNNANITSNLLTAAADCDAAFAVANVNTLVSNADSSTLIMSKGAVEKNVACNFYGYIDKAKYTQDAQEYSQNIFAIGVKEWVNENAIIDAPYNTVVMKGQPLTQFINVNVGYGSTFFTSTSQKSLAATQNAVYVKTALNSVPTPGALLDGQFGYDATVSNVLDIVGYQTATEATDGATELRIIGNFNVAQAGLANYEDAVIGIEVTAASRATDTKTLADTSGKTMANSVCTKQQTITTDKVYLKLTDEAGTEYTNENGYMFAINLKGIPVTNCNLTVRAFVVQGGVKTYTGLYQITDTSI